VLAAGVALWLWRSRPTQAPYNVLTVAPGQTIAQTAADVERDCGIPAKQFEACAAEAGVYSGQYALLAQAYRGSLEGFLYPETYHPSKQATASAVIKMMVNEYAKVHPNVSYHQLIEASLIEKEATSDSDRRNVASVINNRLAAGMRLQLDPTVVYALGSAYDGGALSLKDTQTKSPYNTYLHTGLPPGPICSPGAASIAAAVSPAKTDYYYYIAKPDNSGLLFFHDYADFLKAKARYKAAN
jgi:UPF0755 protein